MGLWIYSQSVSDVPQTQKCEILSQNTISSINISSINGVYIRKGKRLMWYIYFIFYKGQIIPLVIVLKNQRFNAVI